MTDPISAAVDRGALSKEPAELTVLETRDGMPVISEAEYSRLYNNDIRAAGAETSATFDFQGFVKTENGTFYRDALATNGILKGENHPGIHVGTDGIVDYSEITRNRSMEGPNDVGEYDIYVTVPGALQQELRVYCMNDNCTAVADAPYFVDAEEIEQAQQDIGYIVIRTMLKPQDDSQARRKAELLQMAIVKHLEAGGSPANIMELVNTIEGRFEDADEKALSGTGLIEGQTG